MTKDAEMHAIPPSPIHSPINESPDPLSPRGYYPSILSSLRVVHKYSAYTFSAFSIIHFLNTGVAPLLGQTFADENLTAARALYHFPHVEKVLIGSIGVHLVSGLISRSLKVVREVYWYRQFRVVVSNNAKTGYLLIPLFVGHVIANRYVPWTMDVDVTSSAVGHFIAKHKALGWPLYTAFVSLGALHITNGLGQFLGWTKKRRYRVNTVVIGLWLAGLVKVAMGGLVGGYKGQQYDAIETTILDSIQSFARA